MTAREQLAQVYAAFNERGLESSDEFWHPDIEYREADDFPGAGSYKGREAVRAKFAEYVEVLGIERAELEQVVDHGDRVVWSVRFSGRTSEGVPNAHSWGYAGRLRDGMLIELRAYYDPAEALASAD